MGTDVRTGAVRHGTRQPAGRSGTNARIQWGAIRLAALALAVGLLLGILAPRLLAADDSRPRHQKHHVVTAGQTLWGLAEEYGNGGDKRRFVYEVANLNGLEKPAIYPGQRLILP